LPSIDDLFFVGTIDNQVPLVVAMSWFGRCGYGMRDTHLEGGSFEQAAKEPATANGFREPRMQSIRRISTMTFHVHKILIVIVTEGRGAQDMVALVLRRRIGRIRASHPHTGGNRRWTC
jgi:hypothetical protein